MSLVREKTGNFEILSKTGNWITTYGFAASKYVDKQSPLHTKERCY